MSIVPNILIVDDMKANLLIVEKLLIKYLNEEINILTAESAIAALAIAEKNTLSLVISDVQMPNMDGCELAQALLANEKTKCVPIILMTAAAKEDLDRFKGYQSGAIDYLDKPINAEILLTKVNILLSLYKARKELEQTIYIKSLFVQQLKGDLKNNLDKMTEVTSSLLEESKLLAIQRVEVNSILQHGKSAQKILEEALKMSKLSFEDID